jgi:hypothetical protein
VAGAVADWRLRNCGSLFCAADGEEHRNAETCQANVA